MKKEQLDNAIVSIHQKRQVPSQYTEQYHNLCETIEFDHLKLLQQFHHKHISYDLAAPYEHFTYQVQRATSNLHVYKINIKIAHFSLSVSAIKHPSQNPFKMHQKISGAYGSIYFINIGNQSLCLKSFRYKNDEQFQSIFSDVLKEWSILKICSALGCSPYISDFAGFQIMIYNDCVQFCTEKGSSIKRLTQQQGQQLTNQLRLMHQLNILHLDIKPENIVYSYYYKKPVFIDFGFSKIAQEAIGRKTLTTFKGTPNFCCHQMLKIIFEQEGYVDLYYNDAHSLSQTKKNLTRPMICSYKIENKDEEITNVSTVCQASHVLTLLAFKFHYLQSNIFKARQLLKILIADIKNARQILKFMKQALREVVNLQIIDQDLIGYESMVEYQQLKQQIKINAQLFFRRENHLSIIQSEEADTRCNFNLPSLNPNIQRRYRSYNNFLIIIKQTKDLLIQDIPRFVAIAFEATRFDKRNLSLEDKAQIAQIMIKWLCKGEHQSQVVSYSGKIQNHFQKIKEMMKLLLQFCLTEKASKWTKQHVFDIAQQLILMDVDLYPFLLSLTSFTASYFQEPVEKILAKYEFTRLLETTKIVSTKHTQTFVKLYSTLDHIIKRFSYMIKAQNISQNIQRKDKEMSSILMIMQSLQCRPENGIERLNMQLLSQVKNRKIKSYLLLYMTSHKIDYLFHTMNNHQLLKMVAFVKEDPDIQRLDLLSKIKITTKIMNLIGNIEGIDSYCKYISSVINCPEIYSRMNLNLFKYQKKPNLDFLKERLSFLLNFSSTMKENTSIASDLLEIFEMVHTFNIDKQSIIDQLISLYHIFAIESKSTTTYVPTNTHFHKACINIQIEYYYYMLVPETKSLYIDNYNQAKKQYESVQQIRLKQQDKQRLAYLKFRVNYYEYHRFVSERSLEKIVMCLNNAKDACKILKIDYQVIQLSKLLTQVSYHMKNQLYLNKYVYQLYYQIKKANNISFYFIPKNQLQTMLALSVFSKTDIKLFKMFLIQAVQFIASHPIECFIRIFLLSIDCFISSGQQNHKALHFENILGCSKDVSLQSNPYLLIFYVYSLYIQEQNYLLYLFKKIASNLDKLINYAKRRLLQKYYRAFICHSSEDKRRETLFKFRKSKQYLSGKDRKETGVFCLKLLRKKYICLNNEQMKMKEKIKTYLKYLN